VSSTGRRRRARRSPSSRGPASRWIPAREGAPSSLPGWDRPGAPFLDESAERRPFSWIMRERQPVATGDRIRLTAHFPGLRSFAVAFGPWHLDRAKRFPLPRWGPRTLAHRGSGCVAASLNHSHDALSQQTTNCSLSGLPLSARSLLAYISFGTWPTPDPRVSQERQPPRHRHSRTPP
jgi:hypothetical protein